MFFKKTFLSITILVFSVLLICCGNSSSSVFHVVNFDSRGGSLIESQRVAHGEKIKKPEDPTKKGYDFVNWTYNNQEWSFIGYVVTEDMTLNANWTAIHYKITYELNGGTCSGNPETYTIEDNIVLKAAFKDTYNFIGWTLNGEYVSTIPEGTTGDLILTANWEESYSRNVSISFDSSKGSVSGEGSYEQNSFVTVTAIPNVNCVFEGWFMADDLETLISNNLSYTFVMPLSHVKLFAKFYSVNEIGEFVLSEDGSSYIFAHFSPSAVSGPVDLKDFIIPSTYNGLPVVSIGNFAFYQCDYHLASVIIPDSVTSIGSYAFYECELDSITIGESVISIGNYAFYHCNSLTSIIIPDSVTSIGSYAFSKCYCVKTITLGSGVNTIGDSAFIDNSSSLQFYFYGSLNNWLPIIGKENLSGTVRLYFDNSEEEITALVIPDTITVIPDYAFFRCKYLLSIEIGNGVISIGDGAFRSCDRLESATIGNGITSIGSEVFYFCRELKSVNFHNCVFSIGEGTFQYCSSSLIINYYGTIEKWLSIGDKLNLIRDVESVHLYLENSEEETTSLVIPDTIDSVGNYAFYKCKSLTSVIIEEGVTSVGAYAFAECYSLLSMNIPDSITSIGDHAFYISNSLEFNSYENGFYLGNNRNPYLYFAKQNDCNCTINENCKFIGDLAFKECMSLQSITIPNKVISICYRAFYGCSSLTSIVIPDSVSSIGYQSFSGCSSLSTITFSGTIEEWNEIEKGYKWISRSVVVHCIDGDVQASS